MRKAHESFDRRKKSNEPLNKSRDKIPTFRFYPERFDYFQRQNNKQNNKTNKTTTTTNSIFIWASCEVIDYFIVWCFGQIYDFYHHTWTNISDMVFMCFVAMTQKFQELNKFLRLYSINVRHALQFSSFYSFSESKQCFNHLKKQKPFLPLDATVQFCSLNVE